MECLRERTCEQRFYRNPSSELTNLRNKSSIADEQRRASRLGVAWTGRGAGVLLDPAEEVVLAQPVRCRVDPPQLRVTAIVPDASTHALALLHGHSLHQLPDAAALRSSRTVS